MEQETLLQQTYLIQLPPHHNRDKNLVPGVRDIRTTIILTALQPTMLDNYVPLAVVGDGNCLYRAVSRALYGKEDKHTLLRLMTAMEIAVHHPTYDPSRADFSVDLAMYVPGYTESLQAVCTPGAASYMFHLYAVSAAVARPIMSHCPLSQDHLRFLTHLVVGRNVSPNLPPVNIMWTSAQEPRDLYNFTPNHFVVLHPVQNARNVQPMPCLLIPRVSATNRPLEIDDDISVDSSPTHDDGNDVDQRSPAQDFATPRPPPLQGAVDPVSPADDQQHGSDDASIGIDEPSLEEDPVAVEPEVDYSDIRYEVVPKATQRGRPQLFDSAGYCYGIHRQTDDAIDWRCTKRSADVKCPAMVRQTGDTFTAGRQPHIHAGVSGAAVKARIVRDVKRAARRNPFTSAYTIAEKAVLNVPSVPNQRPVSYLGRIGNYSRQADRPHHPSDLTFDVNMEHVPSELHLLDVSVGPKRHLVLFTDQQMRLLRKARCWYVDGTFHVVKAPFTQLWSIHAFVRIDDRVKQVPLAYVIMSGKRTSDYRGVLKALLDQTTDDQLFHVERVVGDFEAAVWKAVRHVLPHVQMRGCSFHWSQSVWRHIQGLGLQSAYNSDHALHRYDVCFFALNVLSYTDIFYPLQVIFVVYSV